MSKPRLLDLYCCEGGASVGYHRAGFEVEGVDIFREYRQFRYPFKSYRADAVTFLLEHGHEYDLIAASPPCQHATIATSLIRSIEPGTYKNWVIPTREALKQVGKPYIMENVIGADLHDPIILCGCMFGEHGMRAVDTDGIMLYLQRQRQFESPLDLKAPRPCDHSQHDWVGGSYGGARRDKYEAKYVRKGGYVPSIPVQQKLLGIDWMTQNGMFQSIPPVYTEWLGRQALEQI